MNPFGQDAIKAAVAQAVATNIIPDNKRGVVLVAPTVTNGQLDIKAVFAERVGEHWQIGQVIDWHHGGDLGAGITVVGSW